MILAIDPGSEESAFVRYDEVNRGVVAKGKVTNEALAWSLKCVRERSLVIEMIASYGMPVGREVFDTCVWIGRFSDRWEQASGRPAHLVFRKDVKMHLCRNNRAKDSHVRQALLDRFGPGREKAIGKKSAPGPLYGVAHDMWSALALAVTFADTQGAR